MDKHIYHTDKGDIVYWLERRQPRRPTLVFLPGLTADHRLFDAQTAYFAENNNVLTWDAPGHGESRPFDLKHTLPEQAAFPIPMAMITDMAVYSALSVLTMIC